MEPGSIPWPVVTTARTGSSPTAATMRRSRSSWSWKSELSATRTSGSSPGGAVHSPAQARSSRRGPTCLTVGGSGPMKSNARLVITSTRAALRPWSSTCSSGSRPCSERAALSAGSASSQPAITIAASSSSRSALGLVRRRHQPHPEGRDARRRDDVDRRVQNDAGHLRGLGRDLRAEEQELGQHRRGRPACELLADVRGERRRRAYGEPVAHPREALRRARDRPSRGRSGCSASARPVRRPRPADVLGARRLHLGPQHRVGEHAQAVPALHQRARDAHQRRRRPCAVPGGHQQVGHLEPPPV